MLVNQSILIVSYGNFEKEFLSASGLILEKQFNLIVDIEEQNIDISEFYNPERRQYDGNKLLAEIGSIKGNESIKKIGLFKVDLFIPILTYIFGQAMLGGDSGIASLYRLRNERYGLVKDDLILLERFSKVIIHEFGHMFGLIHCHNPSCVMRSSTYVEDIDQKSNKLCNHCKSKISSG